MTDATWRVLVDGPVDGALNMAIDRALLLGRAEGTSPPTLRLYRWRRPTVTLGRFQPEAQVDLGVCGRRGFDVARRPTGGRGVLHDDELTYSVVAARSDGIPAGVPASYRHLCAALADAYRRLGVPAALTARSSGEKGAGACYLHATPADLSLGAAKLSGSAQVWERDCVLQHGSFVISRDVDVEAEVFSLQPGQVAAMRAGTATLADALGRPPSIGEIAAAVCESVSQTLDVVLEPGALSGMESEAAEALAPRFAVYASSG